MGDAVIELHALTKDYGGLRALDGATAVVPRGRVGLLGPNGAGKSTLVKCLLGLVRPSAGRATVLGIDAGARPLELRRRVGYVPEVDCHVPAMTALEFVAYMGQLCGMPARAAQSRAHEVLEYVGLDEERYRAVDGFSFGMRQRVKLAQALVHDPELLLLDEPTNGLDPVGREQMLALIEELGKQHGIAILHSSHLLPEVERVCDQVLVLGQGRVLAAGSLEELRRGTGEGLIVRVQGAPAGFVEALARDGLGWHELAPGRGRVSAASPGDGAPLATRVLRAAVAAGVGVRELTPVRSSLEEVFFGLLDRQPEKVA